MWEKQMSNQSNKPKPTKPAVTTKGAANDFKSVAKRLECDEDRGRFEEKLGKLAKPKPRA
jgi:hypothetical protein